VTANFAGRATVLLPLPNHCRQRGQAACIFLTSRIPDLYPNSVALSKQICRIDRRKGRTSFDEPLAHLTPVDASAVGAFMLVAADIIEAIDWPQC
jgi:hypothetical protein